MIGKIKNSAKNAEITTQQIVLLIVIIASFVVLLIFLFKIGFKDISEKQVCQNSVQLAGKSSFFSNVDCKTNYVCISGGEDCKEIPSAKPIKISLDKTGLEERIMKILADEMADCWWMFGSGKVDYTKWFSSGTVCAVCSQVAFGDKLSSNKGGITYEKFYEYLNSAKKSGDQTYLRHMGIDFTKINKDYLKNKKLEFNKVYAIYTGRKSGSLPEPFSWAKGEDGKAIYPIILEREDKSLGCSSVITKS